MPTDVDWVIPEPKNALFFFTEINAWLFLGLPSDHNLGNFPFDLVLQSKVLLHGENREAWDAGKLQLNGAQEIRILKELSKKLDKFFGSFQRNYKGTLIRRFEHFKKWSQGK